MPSQEIGTPIPNTPHAISVTLPTWEATVGYEEGASWVTSKMSSGYPRFVIHPLVISLATLIEEKFGREGESAMLFPSFNAARRCRSFLNRYVPNPATPIRILQLSTPPPSSDEEASIMVEATIGVVFYPSDQFSVAKQYWQHAGEGISSRMAQYVTASLFGESSLDTGLKTNPNSRSNSGSSFRSLHLKQELQAQMIQKKSPLISASFGHSQSAQTDVEKDAAAFIDQKFGRVLDLKFTAGAKRALCRRICGKVDKSHSELEEMEKARRGKHLSETDVYLFPSGMAAIFFSHHALLSIAGSSAEKSVCFGFPYVDTLNVLRKFGPGVIFLGMGDDASLDELEKDLKSGATKIMALFCECPSNPLLKTPNLSRIRALADSYNFAVVVDETVGNFLNIQVLPYADVVVLSLTKVFSGDSNVMAGSLILNPLAPKYNELKKFFDGEYEDLLWAEDALVLERNSRDFADRSKKINHTAQLVVDLLTASPLVKQVLHPLTSDTKLYYDEIKTPTGGYGGLILFVFNDPTHAQKFFDTVNIHKGPSLGTNFTLACPYTILAHYAELEEVAKWDVDPNLVRVSIGLEDPHYLMDVFETALKEATAND